jgi:pyrrolidone-carboxylate peptidase
VLYTFSFLNSTAQIQAGLIQPTQKTVLNEANLDSYLRVVVRDQPQHIIGLGIYTGKDQEAIRIETTAKNQFRNMTIESTASMDDTIEQSSFLTPITGTKLASSMGNSWCNLISWKIMRIIKDGSLHSQFTFLHIPKTFPQLQATAIINQMIEAAQL